MGPRAKGKAAKTSSPLSTVRSLPTGAIIVEHPPSEVSPPSTQPSKKAKVSSSEKATADTLKKKEYNRGKVALKKYWDEFSNLSLIHI